MHGPKPPGLSERPSALARLLAAPLATLAWSLRGCARLVRFGSLALQGLAAAVEFIKGRFLLFRARPDDVFIASDPRSGTTLTQMILYQLTTDGRMDFPHISEVCPWFERTMAFRRVRYDGISSPRVFKTHLSYRLVPKGPCRYIYVVRDGRDVAVSYFHMQRSHTRFKGSFDVFFSRFMRGRVPWGSWFRHVTAWKGNRKNLRILYLTFEELVGDLEATVRKIAAFCEIEIVDSAMPRILERCGFEFMKRHELRFDYHTERLLDRGLSPGSFIREGRAGVGRTVLSEEQVAHFDRTHAKWFGSRGG